MEHGMRPDEKLLDKRQLAERCGVSIRTVERWVERRLVPFLVLPQTGSRREVRFPESEVKRILEKRLVRPVHSWVSVSSPRGKEVHVKDEGNI